MCLFAYSVLCRRATFMVFYNIILITMAKEIDDQNGSEEVSSLSGQDLSGAASWSVAKTLND